MSVSPKHVRFVTFNICGIKGILSRCAQWLPEKTFKSMFETLKGDVLCFQETKIQSGDITREMVIVPGFNAYFTCSSGKKGYSGVVIYVRDSIRVLHAEEGLTGWLTSSATGEQRYYRENNHFPSELYPKDITLQQGKTIDEQGRVLTLDIGACVVIGVYCPANSQGNMQEYRDSFFNLLDLRIKTLRDAGREVILMGDLNVVRELRDSAPIRFELEKNNIEIEEKEWMFETTARTVVNNLVFKGGFNDNVRNYHPERESMFTCWDQSRNCRSSNFGSRIDFILSSPQLECTDANIMPELVGSDHCPVYADFELNGIEAQTGHALPLLAKKMKNRWPLQIHSFFTKKNDTKPNSKSTGPSISGRVTKESTNSKSKKVKQETVAGMFGITTAKQTPLCKHGEPCVLRRSNKPPRKGAYFYVCGRPPNMTPNKANEESECKTFIWESDL